MKLSKAELRFDEWARYADEDQKMVEIAFKEDGPPNQICFHSQQVAEKYLKGYLVFSEKEFEKNHLLRYLLELCEEVDPEFRELENDVIYLTQFYTEARYPGDIPEFNLPECQKAFDAALRIKEFVLAKIKPEENKGFGAVGIIVILAAIAVLGGGVFLFFLKECRLALKVSGSVPAVKECETYFEKIIDGFKTSSPPASQTQTIQETKSTQPIPDISTWKTYRNEKYGFEVRYPPSFWLDVETINPHTSIGQVEKQKILQLNSNLTSPALPQDDNLGIYLVSLNNEDLKLKTNIEQQRVKLTSYPVGYEFSTSDLISDTESVVMRVADTKALRNFVYFHSDTKSDSAKTYHIEIVLFNEAGDKIILRSLLRSHSRYDAKKEERITMFEKILSTFKFIPSTNSGQAK